MQVEYADNEVGMLLKELEENDLLGIVVQQQAIVKIRFIKNNSNICQIMKNQK